ncbi:MAG: ATP-dependent DNA helicase RecG [Bacteroidia bacterium]|nr:ATP-dependent DNA helicase RecG [Bacteroidia bacterium]
MSDSFSKPVTTLRGIGPKGADALARLGIATIGDLITHFPRRYEDRARFLSIADVKDGEAVTLTGKVTAVENRPTRTKTVLTKVTVDDGSRTLATMTWFNQWRMKQTFEPLIGKRVVVFGTAKRTYATVELVQPEWEPLDEGEATDSLSIGRIVPVYPATEGVTQKGLRKAIHLALERFADEAADPLPETLRQRRNLIGMTEALRRIHFPEEMTSAEAARRRLAYQELLVMQLLLLGRRQAAQALPGIAFADIVKPVEELEAVLPFSLTGAQKRVIDEIARDMASPLPMNRLVQGDVGSGKTAVAMAAMTIAARNGYQSALMAPTEILAEQHLRGVRARLEELGIRVDLLTGSRPAREKAAVKERVASGETGVVVGTHALIQEGVTFRKLGLAIIDEQHRFGVLQRAALTDKGIRPDVLVMTATPIPRTLTLTVYGDLDVSVIDQLPPGRKPIRTHWKRPADKEKIYAGLRTLIAEGRQAYVVCSLVAESEKLTAQAATEMAAHLQKHVFPDLSVGLLHGQMSSEEKETAMRRFRDAEHQVLVATTVIEVGVDVPNAATIVIEDADRFGLAQLHQLRGRVGRGAHASFCILVADPKTPDGIARMQVMTETNDGFRIAEEDLKQRGPGEFFGVRQSGVPGLKIADVLRDTDTLQEARQDAIDLLTGDPKLSWDTHRALREKVVALRRAAELAAIG